MTQNEAKALVARRAVDFVEDGMAVGLGTGSTATLFIRELGARKLDIRCVASSDAIHELAKSLGMSVHTLTELPELDVYIDGADEVCVHPDAGLDLIKGGGGALLREKIVASAAKRFIVVADSTKVVTMLGKFPLPVEVIRMALPLVEPGGTPRIGGEFGVLSAQAFIDHYAAHSTLLEQGAKGLRFFAVPPALAGQAPLVLRLCRLSGG